MKRKILTLVFLGCLSSLNAPAVENPSGPMPWEYWKDPGLLARIPDGLKLLYSSSHAEGYAAFDRSSEGDTRFLKIVDGEGVVFEAEGPGFLSRIWMTQGDGKARAIDERIRLRIRIDGKSDPLIDVALASFFSRRTALTKRPLVLDYQHHGGGNISRLPISFSSGCRVSLLGAEKAKFWYQINGMSWRTAGIRPPQSLEEDARSLLHLLKKTGRDPWPAGDYETSHASIHLESGRKQDVLQLKGEGQINALLLSLPAERRPDVELRLHFDGRESAKLRLPWFFGVAGADCLPPKSLFIGGSEGILYSYFPMPFRREAKISLQLISGAPVDLEYSLRFSRRAPAQDAGLFEVRAIDSMGFRPGQSSELLRVEGAVRLAGLFLSVGGAGGSWNFLEGDEEFFIDGEKTASWHGTGVEDFFGGGFYFRGDSGRPEVFFGPLSGLNCLHSKKPKSAAMYRLMPADGPVASRQLILRWEGGARGDAAVRWRGVAWLYRLE